MSGFDVRGFVNALFYTYYVFIIIRVIFSWTGIPSNRTVLMVFRFVHDVTEPYLGLFRRLIPLAGPIDFSPLVGLLVLGIIQSFVVSNL
jgi:YggT family protein